MTEYKNRALEIIDEWTAMTGEEQHRFCMNCVLKGIRQGRRLAHGDELGDAVNSAYATVAENLLDADELARNIELRASMDYGESLAGIVSRAAKAVLQRGIYQEKRDSVAISDEEYSLFDAIAGASDTERSAVIRATLKDLYGSLDERNRAILCGIARGETEREVAAQLGITPTAVCHRVAKIRSALRELL